MNLEELPSYLPLIIFAVFFGWKYWSVRKAKEQIPRLLAKGAVIVDVRTSAEFQQGSNSASLNIPLNELAERVGELDKSRPVILCCASGARSGAAARMLKQAGFKEVLNVGAWKNSVSRSH